MALVSSMHLVRVVIRKTQVVLAARAPIARSFLSRVIGLLGHKSLRPGEGLILTACRSIHTCFMRFAIDAVFVDSKWRVVAWQKGMLPWRMSPYVWGAKAVIELPAGTVKRTRLKMSDHLILQPVRTSSHAKK